MQKLDNQQLESAFESLGVNIKTGDGYKSWYDISQELCGLYSNLNKNKTDYENMWSRLKDDIYMAVEEGYERGFNEVPDTADGGQYKAYRYVLDKMNELGENND